MDQNKPWWMDKFEKEFHFTDGDLTINGQRDGLHAFISRIESETRLKTRAEERLRAFEILHTRFMAIHGGKRVPAMEVIESVQKEILEGLDEELSKESHE